MRGRRVFVADVHITPARPDRTERFFRFLEAQEGRAEEVFVLGDLFDVWVSPVQDRHPAYRPIVERIRRLVERGLRIRFVQGNRDFLIGKRFERVTGVRVFEDPTDTLLDGRRVLLTHGDLLCTADRSYQRTRRVLRSCFCRTLNRALPLRVTFAIAAVIRRYSDWAVRRKSLSVLEPTGAAVRRFADQGFDTIVCGHMHRAAAREFGAQPSSCMVYCVGDWEESGSYLEWQAGAFRIRTIDGGNMLITIDGPAGAGKSTIARLLAERLDCAHLDTGAMYRAVTWKALQIGLEPSDRARIERLAQAIDLAWSPDCGITVDGHPVALEIRSPGVTSAVSEVSAYPGVRAEMVKKQRLAASGRTLVVEGRDIGTVVFPDAQLRFYLDASPEERARRRAGDLRATGEEVDADAVLEGIEARDRTDSTRKDSPLRLVEGMQYVDTTRFSAAEVVEILAKKVLETES